MADAPRLAALLYAGRGTGDLALAGIATRLAESGLRLAGFVQTNPPRPDRPRCDMVIEELGGGRRLTISQDLGAAVDRGCRLDRAALEEAAALALAAVDGDIDLLVLSKFGKREIEGGGFRQAIERAVERGVPVLVGLNVEHRGAWEEFAGDLGAVIAEEEGAIDWAMRAATGTEPAPVDAEPA